ncbi:hypothetical protein V8B55DRAFT_1463983 [Mucor lusitanicus]
MSKPQSVNEETPLLPAPLLPAMTADQTKFYSYDFRYFYRLYSNILSFRYYQQQSGTIDVDIPLEDCAIPQVQAIVSEASAIIVLLTYTTTLLVASYYGNLSDRKGRRFVMISATLGSLVELVLFVITLKCLKSLATVAFGNMLAVIYSGSSIGPPLTNSINSIFYMAFVVQMCLGLYIWLIVPESNDITSYEAPIGKEGKTFLQRINLFSALRVLYRGSSQHASPHALALVAGIQFLLFVVALPPILLYTMLQFGWTAYEGGLFVSLISFSRVIVMLALLPLLAKLFHKNRSSSATPKSSATKPASSSSSVSSASIETRSNEEIKHAILFDAWMIRTGLSVETVCFVLFGLSLAMLAGPSLRSLSTSLVAPSEIGELLGAVAVLEACGVSVAVFFFDSDHLSMTINTIYSASVGIMPNLIFFVCAAICGLALTCSFFVHPSKSLEKDADVEEDC